MEGKATENGTIENEAVETDGVEGKAMEMVQWRMEE